MSSFREAINVAASRARAHHAQAAIRATHGRGAARWLAGQAGISPRTARRWLSAGYPRGRTPNIIEAATAAAGRTGIAAVMIATASGMDVGTVEVEYGDESAGSRNIGYVPVDDRNAAYMMQAAEDLAAGDLDAAADAFSNAVMAAYGEGAGLEDTLTISDYNDGIQLS